MKRALLGLLAALGLSSCSTDVAGTIGTGNTAGVAGVATLPNGEHASAAVYLYKAEDPSVAVATIEADSTGRFAFEKLAEGNYLVFVDRNGQVGMLSDTLKLKADATAPLSISLLPYALVLDVATGMDGYCAVSANELVTVGKLRYWRVPQKSGSYPLQLGGAAGYSVSWDSSDSVASLYRNGVRISSDSVLAHVESLPGKGLVGTELSAGNSSAWVPGPGQQLRIQLAYSFDSVSSDTSDLVRLDDASKVYVTRGITVVHAGVTIPLDSISVGEVQQVELILDGSSDSLTVTIPNSSVNATVSLPDVKMSKLLGPKLTLGNTGSNFRLHGVTISLVAHRVY